MIILRSKKMVKVKDRLKVSVDFNGKFTGSWDIPREKNILRNNFKITEELISFCLKENKQDLKVTYNSEHKADGYQ